MCVGVWCVCVFAILRFYSPPFFFMKGPTESGVMGVQCGFSKQLEMIDESSSVRADFFKYLHTYRTGRDVETGTGHMQQEWARRDKGTTPSCSPHGRSQAQSSSGSTQACEIGARKAQKSVSKSYV